MIDRIIEISARHRLLVLAITALACIGGWFSMERIPLDALPDLSETQVILVSRWDRDPAEIEAQVTYPLVTALSGAPKIKTVRAVSDFGYSYVYAIFQDGTDRYWARARAAEAVAAVASTLPKGVVPTLGPDSSSLGWVFQYVLVDRRGTHTPAELRSLQDWYLRPHLRSVPGVSEIASVGGFGKQYQISVDPLRLRDRKLTIDNVTEALRTANSGTGARLLESGDIEYMVRGNSDPHSVRDLVDTVISASANGTPIRVGDIAQVAIGPDLRRGAADLDGHGEAVSGIVIMRDGESVPAVLARVKQRLHEIAPGLPAGVEVLPIYDRSDLIARSVSHLRWTLLEIVLTVAVVILVFLRHLPSALVPILTLPIALLISFLPFYGMGLTANIMSLAGLAIAVGALVDASVVVVEQTHLRLEEWEREGRPGLAANVIVRAMQQVARPSFFAILIIALAFLPVLTLGGEEGRLFRPLAFTKSFAMVIGAILAITLDPALRITLMQRRAFHLRPLWLSAAANRLFAPPSRRSSPSGATLVRMYEPVVRWSLTHRAILLTGTAALALAALWAGTHLGSELMPPFDEGVLLYMPSTPPGISLTEAKRLLTAVDRTLSQMPEVDHVLGKTGRASTATDPAPLSMFECVITLKPDSAWPRVPTWYSAWTPDWLRPVLRPFAPDHESLAALTARMDRRLQIPGVTNSWTMPLRGRIDMLSTGIRTPLGIKVMGPDPATIGLLSQQIGQILESVPGARRAFSERLAEGYYVDVHWDRGALARYGISPAEAQGTLSAAIGGEEVATIAEGRERYPVSVRYMRDYRSDIASLRRLLLPTAIPGVQVPLASVATVERRTGPSMLRDEHGLLTGYVFLELSTTDLGTFRDRGEDALHTRLALPPGYTYRWDGQYAAMAETRSRLLRIVPATLALVFLLLLLATRSAVKSLIVLLAVPFSAIGAFLLLAALGYHLSAAVSVGLIALLGVDAETGIFMLLYLDIAYHAWQSEGRLRTRRDLTEIIVEGAARRIRPKLMTATTMLIGLLPILWSTGPGAEITRRISVPLIGGIASSFLLELLIYPILYQAWRSRSLPAQDAPDLSPQVLHSPELVHSA